MVTTKSTAIARHENSFVRVGAHFYLLGGRGIKPISIYNSKTNTWTTGKEPLMEIHHFQGVAYQGKIYVIGAMTGKYPYETPVANILIYDPTEDTWEIGPEIPSERRRGSSGVVVKDNKAYIISGIVDGHNDKHVPWVDSYDFKSKTWKILADAPRARDHFQAAIRNGKIYAVSGRNSSYKTQQTFELTIPEVDIYNIRTNRWSTLGKPFNLPTERAGASTVLYKNYLMVVGGESSSLKTAHDEVEVFDLKKMEWRVLNSLKRGRHGTQAILHKKHVYIAAGSGNKGGKPELSSLEKIKLTKSLF
jgi:N-acetylneuraminic acid mutarotase